MRSTDVEGRCKHPPESFVAGSAIRVVKTLSTYHWASGFLSAFGSEPEKMGNEGRFHVGQLHGQEEFDLGSPVPPPLMLCASLIPLSEMLE